MDSCALHVLLGIVSWLSTGAESYSLSKQKPSENADKTTQILSTLDYGDHNTGVTQESFNPPSPGDLEDYRPPSPGDLEDYHPPSPGDLVDYRPPSPADLDGDHTPNQADFEDDHVPSHAEVKSDHTPSQADIEGEHTPARAITEGDSTTRQADIEGDHTPSQTDLGVDYVSNQVVSRQVDLEEDHAPTGRPQQKVPLIAQRGHQTLRMRKQGALGVNPALESGSAQQQVNKMKHKKVVVVGGDKKETYGPMRLTLPVSTDRSRLYQKLAGVVTLPGYLSTKCTEGLEEQVTVASEIEKTENNIGEPEQEQEWSAPEPSEEAALPDEAPPITEDSDVADPPQDLEATDPHEDLEATDPQGDLEAADPQGDLEATDPHGDLEATDPQGDLEATDPTEDLETEEERGNEAVQLANTDPTTPIQTRAPYASPPLPPSAERFVDDP